MGDYQESRKRRICQVRKQSKEIASIIQNNVQKERKQLTKIIKEIKNCETDAELNASFKVLENYFEECLCCVGQGFKEAEYETSLQMNKDEENKVKKINYRKIAIARGKEALLNKQKENEERKRKQTAISHIRQAVLKKEKKRTAKVIRNYHHQPDVVEKALNNLQNTCLPKSVYVHDQSSFPLCSVKKCNTLVEKNDKESNNAKLTLIEINEEENKQKAQQKMKEQRTLKSKERYKAARKEQILSKEYSNILENLEKMKIAERKKKTKEIKKENKDVLLHEFNLKLLKDKQFRDFKPVEVTSKDINFNENDVNNNGFSKEQDKEFQKIFPLSKYSVFDTESTTAKIFYTDPLSFTKNYASIKKSHSELETAKNNIQEEVPEWENIENLYEKKLMDTGQKVSSIIEKINAMKTEISKNKTPKSSSSSDKKKRSEKSLHKNKIQRTRYIYKYPKKYLIKRREEKSESISSPIEETKPEAIFKYRNFGTQTNNKPITEDKENNIIDSNSKSDSLYPSFSSNTSYYSLPEHHGKPQFSFHNESTNSSGLSEDKTEYENLLKRYKKLITYKSNLDRNRGIGQEDMKKELLVDDSDKEKQTSNFVDVKNEKTDLLNDQNNQEIEFSLLSNLSTSNENSVLKQLMFYEVIENNNMEKNEIQTEDEKKLKNFIEQVDEKSKKIKADFPGDKKLISNNYMQIAEKITAEISEIVLLNRKENHFK
ncbi:repetitive organellar protein-like isoform X2 [Centruroides vittatus]